MKKVYLVLISIVFVLAFTVSACTNSNKKELVNTQDKDNKNTEEIKPTNVQEDNQQESLDNEALQQTISDWVMGTDYNILNIEMNVEHKNLIININQVDYDNLENFQFEDIIIGLSDLLLYFNLSPNDYILVWPNNETSQLSGEVTNPPSEQDIIQTNDQTDSDIVNLIFIHHSVGENWLADGLNNMLNENNFHVADTNYGWSSIGDNTDTTDWSNWFNDNIMPQVFNELNTQTAFNNIPEGQGENTVIMFKSCFPNSDVGNSIDDEKAIYNELLNYFKEHTDKMFILITPPPMQNISNPKKTRELTNWLVDKTGLRANYDYNNLYVFDLYNVLTSPQNHHYIQNGEERHEVNDNSNTLHYDSSGDDHPNTQGNNKATQEFIPLLNYWYSQFASNQ